MAKLVLVRHSLPAIDPASPPAAWPLAPDGVTLCGSLAKALTPWLPAALVCSPEPKALATAARVGARLGLTPRQVPGLEEHHRADVPLMEKEQFRRAVQGFFARRSELVLGEETADAAHARFSTTVDRLMARHPRDNLVVVAHGTVVALYVGGRTGLDAFTVWSSLGLPSFVVLDSQSWRVEAMVTQVG